MKTLRYLLFVGLVGFSTLALGQTPEEDYSKKYTGAKMLFSQGNYKLAMEAFKPLIQTDENNKYSQYASFYYALSAYKQGYLPMAKNMLLQIKQLYPNWSKTGEVNLWLGITYFELEEYNSALNALSEVKKGKNEEYIKNLKAFYLSKIENTEVLKGIFENNPEEVVLGKLLAKRIASQSLADRDQQLLEQLIKKFDLDTEQLNISMVTETVYKDTYKVAVVLPFIMSKLEPNERPKINQFVIDLYEGIKLAIDTLQKSGIDIQLLAYDTKRDSATTAAILEKPELKGVDVIIGPLSREPTMLVTNFAYQNKINVINPFFASTEIINNNPFSFLYRPSSEVVGERAAEYVSETVKNKNGIIFYSGDSKQDSVLAFSYKKAIEKEGFNIIINKKINKDSTRAILDLLLISNRKIKEASTEEARDKFKIAPDSVGHIFVASDNDLISSKVISAVETRGDSIIVVGSANWMELPAINYDTYDRLKTILYAPALINKETEQFAVFRDKYIAIHKKAPSNMVTDGFELMMFIGKSLKQHGKYFQLGWNKEGYMPGYLAYGYNYKDANTNLLVPFISFEGEEMDVIINKEDKRDEHRKK